MDYPHSGDVMLRSVPVGAQQVREHLLVSVSVSVRKPECAVVVQT